MATAQFYPPFIDHLAQKRIDLDSDALKAALVTSGYTYSAAHDFFNDITNEVTGTGYTAGGVALTSVTWTSTAANSWGTARANSTAYAQGQLVRPATGNGFIYMASTGGTSGGSIPTYPTVVGQTVTDGSVVWTCMGQSIYALDCADPTWASSTISAAGLVVYDSTPGTAATNPLICFVNFGSTISSTGAAFTYVVDPAGICYFIV